MARAPRKCPPITLPEAQPQYHEKNEQETRRLLEIAINRPCSEAAEGCPLFCGLGSPEGVVVSPIGGVYEQTDAASTSHSIWVKHSGTGDTGWRAWAGMRGGDGTNTALRMGDGSVASAASAIAFGEGAQATGASAVALGDGAEATNADGVSIGQSVAQNRRQVNIGKLNSVKTATGWGEVIIGYENDGVTYGGTSVGDAIVIGNTNFFGTAASFGGSLIVIGQENDVEASNVQAMGNEMLGYDGLVGGSGVDDPTYGVMIGTEVEAQADCFIAVGYQSKAYGIGATAAGPHTQAGTDADSLYTTALGRFAAALGDKSLALGSHTTVNHDGSIALGHNATPNTTKQLMIGDSGDQINDVSFNGGSSPAFVVDASGNVTIRGSIAPSTRTITGTTTLLASDYTVNADVSGGGYTVNLPAAASVPGQVYVIRKPDSSGNTVTIDGNGAETINGAATQSLTTQYQTITIQSTGTGWQIIG